MNSAARLRRLREILGLSQRELAREFKVSSGAIGLWEKGRRPVPGPVLKLLEFHEHYLFTSPESSDSDPFSMQTRQLSKQWAQSIVTHSNFGPSKKRAETQKMLENVLHKYLSDGLSSDPIKRRVQVSVCGQLVSSMRSLKGVPLKAAQLASYLDFSIPDELRAAMAEVQSTNTPMPAGQASRVVFEEFGKRPEKLFAAWDPKPFAVASIGQVHRAKLTTGEDVAVKVQHLGLRSQIEADLENIGFFHHFAILLHGVNPDVIQDLKSKILTECDFRVEAENHEKFYSAFRGDPEILIPRIFHEYSTGRVLTTEFIRGKSFSEFMASSSQEEKDRAGMHIVRFYTEPGFKYGFFQGDPNPGNYIFCGERTAFIDFGRTIFWDLRTRVLERDLCMSVLENTPMRAQSLLEELGFIAPLGKEDFLEFWDFFSAQHTPLTIDQPFQYSRPLIAQRLRIARSYTKNPMTRVNKPLFWDVFLAMSANAIRGDFGSKANWRRHLLEILKSAGAVSGL